MSSRAMRVVLVLAGFLGAGLALAAGGPAPPAETARGKFVGTWFRIDPWERQTVQVRLTPGGKSWDVRLIWQISEQVTIDTNWQRRVTYTRGGLAGSLELAVDPKRSTPNRLVLTYRRDEDTPDGSHMTEDGDVQLYRAGEGRSLVWLQDPLRTKTAAANPIAPYEEDGQKREAQRVWMLAKASHRLLEADEIPW